MSEKLVKSVLAKFRFRYVGGGYFRDKLVPKGKHAETLHGDEVLKEFAQELIEALAETRESHVQQD